MSVDTITGEVYQQGLTPFEARQLTDEIRQTLTVGHDLLIRAYEGRAWTALGYPTWDAYCAGEFTEARMVRLDREQRRQIVAEMRMAGMSTPAIGAALGVSDETARRDLMAAPQSVENLPPVTRTDGIVRTEPRKVPQPVPSASPRERQRLTSGPSPKRRPLTDAFSDATFDLTKVTERLERLIADDRFPQNAEQVAAKNRGDLLRAAEALARVVNQLT